MQTTPGSLTCPSCLTEHSFPSGAAELKKLIKNFSLISLVEAAKGAKATVGKPNRLAGSALKESAGSS
jgi:hypothetical protein